MNHEIHEAHEKAETLAEIVAEMRALAESAEAWQDGVAAATVARLANRIKAASRLEVDKLNSVIQAQRSAFDAEQDRQRREHPGNAAKLREALAWVDDCLKRRRVVSAHEIGALRTQIAAALAAPPRNCDVGTATEQVQRFEAFCDAHKYVGDDGTNWCSTTCPCYNGIDCGVRWAQMPYEKGEPDGSK